MKTDSFANSASEVDSESGSCSDYDADYAPVQLGYVIRGADPKRKKRATQQLCGPAETGFIHPYPSKVGGNPIWLWPKAADARAPGCDVCKRPMQLLVQVYTAEDEPAEAYHRYLYVFVCMSARCHKTAGEGFGAAQSACVLRSQAPKEHPGIMATEPRLDRKQANYEYELECSSEPESDGDENDEENGNDEDDDDDDDDDYDDDGVGEEEKDKVAAHQNTGCSDRLKCTSEIERKAITRHDDNGNTIEKPTVVPKTFLENAFNSFSREPASACEKADASENGGKAEDTPAHANKDACFARFQQRLQRMPRQVLRYVRGSTEGKGAVLRVRDRKEGNDPLFPDAAPAPCDACGGERQLEMQVLSTVLNYHEEARGATERVADDALDFGTFLVYTCRRSCAIGRRHAVEAIAREDFAS